MFIAYNITFMDEIKQHCPEYFENSDNLCFKTCHYNWYDYIVVMSKLPDTKTNESRIDIVNPLYAKFRGNKFMVLKIFSRADPSKTINEIQNSYYDKKITYKTGEEISVDDFDNNLEKVCSTGIHYFKSVEAAFYYGDPPINYSGKWFEYHDNGNIGEEGEYLNGKRNGIWNVYYENGINKKKEENYLNGQLNGTWIWYYDNGNKREEGKCVNDERNGKWIFYYENGNKRAEGEYFNGRLNGQWIFYYENGHIEKECEFLNDKII